MTAQEKIADELDRQISDQLTAKVQARFPAVTDGVAFISGFVAKCAEAGITHPEDIETALDMAAAESIAQKPAFKRAFHAELLAQLPGV